MHLTKHLILTAIVAVLLANSVFTQESVSAPKRNSLLSKRANPNAFKKTTTSTEAPAYEDEEYEEGAVLEGNDKDAEEDPNVSSTTTESAKKVRPIIRPFRSNDDLLNALKKRRLSEKSNKSEKAVTEREFDYKVDAKTTKSPKPTPAIPTSSYNSKSRKYGKPSNPKAPVADQQAQTLDDTLPSKAFRRSPASRFATKN